VAGADRPKRYGCEGYDILAAVGGDGTANEILSGIMDRQESKPALAIIPAGTGNDIAFSVGIKSVEDAVSALAGGQSRTFDLFRIDCQADSQPAHRYAFLACGIGFSAVSYSMLRPWMKRIFGSKGTYFLVIAMGAIVYRPSQMTVRWENHEYSGPTLIIIIGNAEWLSGGSMRVSPGARMDDGELNVTIAPSQSKLSALRKIAKTASGTHIKEPDILYFPAKRIEIDSIPPTRLVIDGDIFGTTPAAFTVCTNAIKIVTPQESKE